MPKIRIRSKYRSRTQYNLTESPTVADTITGTVIPAGGGGPVDHPNEPAGFTPLCENYYETIPGLTVSNWVQNQQGATGWWWNNGMTNLAIRSNGGHPLAESYLEIKYPLGLKSGSAPAFYIGWSTPAPTYNQQMRELYTYTVFRYRGPASDPNNWAWEPVANKFYYVAYKSLNNFNQGTVIFRRHPFPSAGSYVIDNEFRCENRASEVGSHSGTAQAGSSNTITLATAASTTDNLYNNSTIVITGGTGAGQQRFISDYTGSTRVALISTTWATTPDNTSQYAIGYEKPGGAVVWSENIASSPALLVNEWHVLEDYWKLNTQTVPPTEDGVRTFWVDGILRGHHTDVRYTTLDNWDIGFHQYRFDPVWGGVSAGVEVPADQYLDIAYTYVSGVPL